MASLYKKPVWTTDPATGQKAKSKSKKWWGRFRGANGLERRVPLARDKSAAQASGVDDVFMNILTTNGLVGRYVTDWAGPDARVTRVAIRLGTPNLPGDTMRMSGTVKGKDDAASTATIEVQGANAWGNHVTGTVVVELP